VIEGQRESLPYPGVRARRIFALPLRGRTRVGARLLIRLEPPRHLTEWTAERQLSTAPTMLLGERPIGRVSQSESDHVAVDVGT
jgi:hypothetical protein